MTQSFENWSTKEKRNNTAVNQGNNYSSRAITPRIHLALNVSLIIRTAVFVPSHSRTINQNGRWRV